MSINLLKTFYHFNLKNEEHNNWTLNELRMILFLTQFRDSYSPVNFKLSDLKRDVYANKISSDSLYKILDKFGFIQLNDLSYQIKLNDSWRVDHTPNGAIQFKQKLTSERKANTNPYASLNPETIKIMFSSSDINFWKLALFILYCNYSNPSLYFNFDLDELYKRLDIKMHRSNKALMKSKMIQYINMLFNSHLISEGAIIIKDEKVTNELIWRTNRLKYKNEIVKDTTFKKIEPGKVTNKSTVKKKYKALTNLYKNEK